MTKVLLPVLAALLLVAPFELSAKHVVKHHVVHAQARAQPGPQAANPNCALGGTPPAGTQCGISDLTLRPGGALQDTDTMRLCPNASGCFGTSTTYQDAQAPLGSLWTPYFRSKLSQTAPITYNSSTGAIGCTAFAGSATGCVPATGGAGATSYLSANGTWSVPAGSGTGLSSVGISVPASSLFGVTGSPLTANGTIGLTTTGTTGGIAYFSSATQMLSTGAGTTGQVLTSGGSGAPTWSAAGGTTTITLAPGLCQTANCGTYNTGTQTVSNSQGISPQLMWEGHSSSFTLAATDSAKLIEMTAASLIATLPSMGIPGSGSYSFSFGPAGAYTVNGGGSNIYGCGVNGLPQVTISFDATFVPTNGGNGWKCSGSGNTTTDTMSWGPGMNLATSPIPMVRRGTQVQVSQTNCMAGVVVNSTPALVDLYDCPVGTVPNGSNCTKINATSCVAGTGTGGGAGVNQILGGAAVIIPVGDMVWAYGSGTGWGTAGATTSSSGMIEITASP